MAWKHFGRKSFGLPMIQGGGLADKTRCAFDSVTARKEAIVRAF
jgi:hypothetical protein